MRKTFILLLIIIIAGVGVYVKTKPTNYITKAQVEVSLIGYKQSLFVPKNQILNSHTVVNNRLAVYVTSSNIAGKTSTVYIKPYYSKQFYLVFSSAEYPFYTTPTLSPNGKLLAVASLFPNQIWTVNTTSLYRERVIIAPKDEKDIIFNPKFSKEYKLALSWSGDNEIVFEDYGITKLTKRAVDVSSKQVRIYSEQAADVSKKNVVLNVPFQSQRDATWKGEPLGTCEKETIGKSGCAIAAISMVLKYYGWNGNVSELNKILTKGDAGYVEGCAVKWFAAVNIANLSYTKGYFNKFDLDIVHASLNAGNPVIIGFNTVWYTGIPHWVVITGYKNGEYIINDPWDSKAGTKTLADFGGKFDHIVLYSGV